MRLLGWIVAFVLCSVPANAVEVRYLRWIPVGHHLEQNVLIPWMQKITEATNKRVTFTVVNLQAPVTQHHEMIVKGIIDVVFSAEAYTPGQFPLSEILELPGNGDDVEKLSVAYWKVYEEFFAKTNPYPGIKVLGLTGTPPANLFTSNKAIRLPDDIKGLKLRVAGEASTLLLKGLGATTVTGGLGQAAEMMSSGVIDGIMLHADGIASFGMAKFVKNETFFAGGLASLSDVLWMNEAKWNSISVEDRAVIDKLSGEMLSRQLGSSFQQSNIKNREVLQKQGVATVVADAAFLAKIHELAVPLEQAWFAKAKEKGVDGAAALKRLRELAR